MDLLNLYTPSHDCKEFWDGLFRLEIIDRAHLLLGGDINFTLYASDSQVQRSIKGILDDRFSHQVHIRHLVYIEPDLLGTTLLNKHSSGGFISKRLDHFLLSEDFLISLTSYRSSNLKVGHFYHFPILLEITLPSQKLHAPPKFNPHWMIYEDFR